MTPDVVLDVALGREYVRERVRGMLADASGHDSIEGQHGDYRVTFSYSLPVTNPPETDIRVELPTHHGFELRLKHRDRTPNDAIAIHGFSGTSAPLAAARFLLDRPTCERLWELRVTDVRIAAFDIKDSLPRRARRLIEQSPPEIQYEYRSQYRVWLTVRGWIEDPERAVATIALAIDIASRVGDAVTRAAGAELATGPYRDAPSERAASPVDHGGLRRLVGAAYTLLSRALGGWWPS